MGLFLQANTIKSRSLFSTSDRTGMSVSSLYMSDNILLSTWHTVMSLSSVHVHIKDPVSLIKKRRGLSPSGRFPPSFIHLVIIITGLNKLYNCMFSP